MQVYLVGGAVRDELLGCAVKERDWVVVGATPEELLRQGYQPAGRDFPVFLHPTTHEEYALARLERKVGPGYRGFTTGFSPEVSLEEDLRRRDLTINAMARAADGRIIDPYGGQADLRQRLLRHVSAAFVEDPVRILRVARFAARLASLGFTVAPQTQALMHRMVESGEAAALVSERVWRELERALGEAQPTRFFEVLADCGALAVVLPELAPRLDFAMYQHDEAAQRTPTPGGPAAPLAALTRAAEMGAPTPVRWAALLSDLGEEDVEALCARLRAPNDYRDLALLAARLGAHLHGGGQPPEQLLGDPEWLMTLFEIGDAIRRPERFEQWLQVLAIRAQAAGAAPPASAAMGARLRSALAAVCAVKLPESQLQELPGPAIAARLRALRLVALGQRSAALQQPA
jgi:tRNA nucleotidyltransferase (CCA-adding enzyme)